MFPRRLVFAYLAMCWIFADSSAFAQSRAAAARPTNSVTAILNVVPTKHRHLVAEVMTKPTVSATYTEEPFQAHANVYSWMLEHPDRVSLAWRRMKVDCVEINALSDGRFSWTDENGSQLTWQVVAKLPDGVVWYASGKVKAATLLPVVPIKAVAIVRYTGQPTKQNGVLTLTPEASVYLLSESRAANVVLRMVGPAAPKLAKDGAEQLLFFFSGVASHLRKNPEQVPSLLGAKSRLNP